MRYVFSSLLGFGLMAGLAWGQNPQPNNLQPGQQPPAGQQQPQAAQKVQPGQQQPGQQQPGQQQPGQQQPGQQQPGQQQPGQQLQPGQRQPVGQAGQQHAGTSDQQIAALICGCAQNEIEIAKFAQEKAQSSEVKQFAEQMIREHSPACDEMRQLAGSLANHNNAGQGAQPGSLDWVRIHQEVGQQCLASVKKELSDKKGEEFDHCFMGQQIGAHMKVIDELKVLRNHASPELRQKLDKELQMATTHFEKAKKIEEGLSDDDDSPTRVSRKQDKQE